MRAIILIVFISLQALVTYLHNIIFITLMILILSKQWHASQLLGPHTTETLVEHAQQFIESVGT